MGGQDQLAKIFKWPFNNPEYSKEDDKGDLNKAYAALLKNDWFGKDKIDRQKLLMTTLLINRETVETPYVPSMPMWGIPIDVYNMIDCFINVKAGVVHRMADTTGD